MFRRYHGPRRRKVRGVELKGWYVRVYNPGTKSRVWLSLRTEDYRVAQARKQHFELNGTGAESQTFRDAAAEWLKDVGARVAPRTLENLEASVAAWPARWQGADVSTITSSDIRTYLAAYRKTHAATTTNKERAHLRWLFTWLVKEGRLGRNPVSAVSQYRVEERLPRALTPEEQERLEAALRLEPPEVEALFFCALHAGLRRRTVLELRWEHINWERGWWQIPGSAMKSGRPFVAPIRPVLLGSLRRLRAASASTAFPLGPVFRLSASRLEARWHDLCRRTGIQGVRFHDLRKSFVTGLRQRGVTLEEARRLSDHRDLATLLKIYSAVSDEQLEVAIEKGEKQVDQVVDNPGSGPGT